MPMANFGHAVVEVGQDLYVIGGYDGGNHKEIQRLSCSSQVCTWTTINQQLKVARRQAVAIPICKHNFATVIVHTLIAGVNHC